MELKTVECFLFISPGLLRATSNYHPWHQAQTLKVQELSWKTFELETEDFNGKGLEFTHVSLCVGRVWFPRAEYRLNVVKFL